MLSACGRLAGRRVLPLALGLVMVAGAGARADDNADAQEIIDSAASTVQLFRSGDEKEAVEALLAQAKGVMVYPSILSAAFLVGAEGGTGVLLAHGEDGSWSAPAFFTFAGASYGFQAGAQDSKVLMIIMKEEALERAVDGGLELGADASVAAGSEGLSGQISTDQLQDIYYFDDTRGLFAGVNFEGSTTVPRDGMNEAYYRTPATARDVVLARKVPADGAAALQGALAD